MTNSDDPTFDDILNSLEDQEQQELDILSEDAEQPDVADDTLVNPGMFYEDSTGVPDLPDESLFGENTSPFADDLDMLGDMASPDEDAMLVVAEDLATSEGSLDDLFDDLSTLAEPENQSEMIEMDTMVDPVLPLPVEEVPVEDKKSKKSKKEKAPKAIKEKPPKKEKVSRIKKEKKPKELRDKQPWNFAVIDVALTIATISLVLGCLFLLVNLASNLS